MTREAEIDYNGVGNEIEKDWSLLSVPVSFMAETNACSGLENAFEIRVFSGIIIVVGIQRRLAESVKVIHGKLRRKVRKMQWRRRLMRNQDAVMI